MGRRVYRMVPVFVETMPEVLEPGKLYVSPKFRTVTHSCACGCGVEINTPLHPTGWQLVFDGLYLSLSPSVGNWSEECQSHYWIEDNEVLWAGPWSRAQIDQGRRNRKAEIEDYFSQRRRRRHRRRRWWRDWLG